MAECLKKKLHIRNGHRCLVSGLITYFSRTDVKLKVLKNLDDEILELIPEDEPETLTNEIDKSCQFSDEINDIY